MELPTTLLTPVLGVAGVFVVLYLVVASLEQKLLIEITNHKNELIYDNKGKLPNYRRNARYR